VNYVQLPDVLDAENHLTHDQPGFLLTQSLAHFQQDAKVKAIAVVHDHVNVGAGLDGLVQFDGMFTVDHGVDAHFLLDTVHVVFADVGDVDDLAGVNLFGRVRRRSVRCLFFLGAWLALFLICDFLRLAYFSVLAFAEIVIDVDEKAVYFSDSWLFDRLLT
jgi:hypothetical protein